MAQGSQGSQQGLTWPRPPQFRTLPAEEVRQVLRSLESHYQEFLRDSQDSQSFQPDDRLQVERDYNACTHKYELLLRSQEKGGCPRSAFSERWVSPGFPQVLSVLRSPWCPWGIPMVLSRPSLPPPHLGSPGCPQGSEPSLHPSLPAMGPHVVPKVSKGVEPSPCPLSLLWVPRMSPGC